MLATPSFHLKTSRPGLWFITVWLFVLPTSGLSIWGNPVFWVGLVYFTFPFNYFLYSWNDWEDRDIDTLNPRKNNYLFGVIAKPDLKKQLLWINALIHIPFWAFFAWHTGYYMIWWLAALFFLNYIYNSPRVRLSRRPVLGLFVSLQYILAFVMSVKLNGNIIISPQTYLFLILVSFSVYLVGEILEIVTYGEGGRKTFATLLGYRYAKLMAVLLQVAAAYIVVNTFDEWVVGSLLIVASVLLLADAFVGFKNKPYPLRIIKAIVFCANLAAIATMVWLWLSGSLV